MIRRLSTVSAVLAMLAACGMAYGGDDVTSLSYISYLERYATLHPAQEDQALDAVVNMPVLAGDRLETTRGARVEVQLSDGSTVWVDEFTTLDFDAIALSRDSSAPRTALFLNDGTVAVEIPSTAAGDGTIRVDSSDGTVNLNRPGLYRLDIHSGQLHVAAFTGLAELPAGVGSALLRTGEEANLGADGQVQKASLSDASDDFWSWVQERRRPVASSRTQEVMAASDAEHAAALDNYGDWVYVNDFSSWMWRPRVGVGWVPYSYGRWYWTPVGWNWISYEPWGWYPFHYGSWYFDAGFGWVWGWDNVWAPSWVDWIYTPGFVGWCPRGYYDWWFVHNCTHCWGEGWRRPGRWGEFTFNLSGRVRFGEVDPRPWTVVPTEQFRNPHLERVRLDPARMRDQLGPRDALVRSGPMLTPPPSRGQFTNGVDSFFRGGGPGREVPDLSAVLRREPGSNLPIGSLKPGRTNDFVAPTRSRAVDVRGGTRTLLDGRDVVNGSQRWRGQVSTPITPGTSTEPSRRLYRRDGGTVNPGGHNPPPVVRRAQPAPPPRVAAPDGRGGSQSPPAAKPAPAPQRPSSSSLSYSRPRSVDRSRWQGGAWGDRRVAPTYRAPYAPRAWSRPLGGSSGYAGPSAGGAARSYSAPSRGGSTSRGGGSTWHPTSGHSGGTRPRR